MKKRGASLVAGKEMAERHRRVLELAGQGVACKAIADRTGYSRETVYRIVARAKKAGA